MAHPHRQPPPRRLRALHTPRTARVRVDAHGRPWVIQLDGKKPKTVEHIRECWRIEDEWWRDPITRMYFDLVLENGRAVMLYLDETTQQWYVHE